MASVYGALPAQKPRNLKGWRHWKAPRALQLVGLAVQGSLPVGGSGDTGMFKTGYPRAECWQRAPFRTAIITEITAMPTACGEGNSGLGALLGFSVCLLSCNLGREVYYYCILQMWEMPGEVG